MGKPLREIYIAVLLACGFRVTLKGATHIYMMHPKDIGTTGERVFVGASGSLRYGKTLSASRPFSSRIKREMIEHYDRSHKATLHVTASDI